MERKELGQLLVDKGILNSQQLEDILVLQRQTKKYLGEILVERGYVTRDLILEALTEQRKADLVKLSKLKGIKQEIVRLVPEHIARRYGIIVIAKEEDHIVLAMKDATDIVAIDTVRRLTGMNVRVVRAAEDEIQDNIERHYLEGGDLTQTLADLEAERGEDDDEFDVNQLKVAAEDAPIIRFVNSLFMQAVEKRSTDIHLEPQETSVSLRFRIDGDLHHFPPPPRAAFPGIVTRLKILSNLDIGERRLPQDGRLKIRVGTRSIDIRLSSIPTVYGEKIVMRLLDKSNLLKGMEELGFEPDHLSLFKTSLTRPYGMIIVTGPTGSGKTTSLYAGLNFINTPDKNIMTVEDPVEYELAGINQVHVKAKIGLTFPAVLRTFLRQDPDVIMVGEIRDLETAQIAIQAALTGHLVISTLHTNDTVSTISRFSYMGVEPYLVAAALNLIMSQRLVRRICSYCKEDDRDGRDILERVGADNVPEGPVFKGKGCNECEFSGYFGRVAIYEMLPIAKEVRRMIVERASEDQIRDYARKDGMKTLRESALKKVFDGVTTVQEALGVTLT